MMTRIFVITFLVAIVSLASAVFAAEAVYGFVKATNGTAVPNVIVSIENSTATFNSTSTNSIGFYNLTFDVNSGIYRINFTTTEFQTASVVKVIFENSGTELNQTLQLLGPTFGTIMGIVKDVNNVALSDANALMENSEVYSVLTNSTGGYKIDAKPGLYNITVSKSGYKDERASATITGGSITGLNFTLNVTPPAMLHGRIVDASNNSLVATLQLKQRNNVIATTQSNSTGNYNFTIAAGNYTIVVSKSGYVESQQGVSLTGGTTTNLNFTLVPSGTLSGIITNGANALIELKQSGSLKASASADVNGSYSITAGIGVYDVVISKSGFQTVTQTINLTSSGVTFSTSLSSSPSPPPSSSSGGGSVSPTPPSPVGGILPIIESIVSGVQPQPPQTSVTTIGNRLSVYLPTVSGKRVVSLGGTTLSEVGITVLSPSTGVGLNIDENYALPEEAVRPEGSVYNYFSITTSNITSDNIAAVAFNFKVSRTWINEFGIDESAVTLERYTNAWEELQTEVADRDDEYIYYKSVSPGFSIFAITGEKLAEVFTPAPAGPSLVSQIGGITGYFVDLVSSNYLLSAFIVLSLFTLYFVLKKSEKTETEDTEYEDEVVDEEVEKPKIRKPRKKAKRRSA